MRMKPRGVGRGPDRGGGRARRACPRSCSVPCSSCRLGGASAGSAAGCFCVQDQAPRGRVPAALPDALQMLAGALRSGFALNQSIGAVVREGVEAGPASSVARCRRCGSAPTSTTPSSGGRAHGQLRHGLVVMSIRTSREVGGNLAEVLETTVHTMRERVQLRGQVQVLSAEGRLAAKVLTGLPILMTVYLFFRRDLPARHVHDRRRHRHPLRGRRPAPRRLVLVEPAHQDRGVVMLVIGVLGHRRRGGARALPDVRDGRRPPKGSPPTTLEEQQAPPSRAGSAIRARCPACTSGWARWRAGSPRRTTCSGCSTSSTSPATRATGASDRVLAVQGLRSGDRRRVRPAVRRQAGRRAVRARRRWAVRSASSCRTCS